MTSHATSRVLVTIVGEMNFIKKRKKKEKQKKKKKKKEKRVALILF